MADHVEYHGEDQGEYQGEYVALGQHARVRRHWWDRLPRPVVRAALRTWSALPPAIRRPLIPLGNVINPGHVVSGEGLESPGPDTVPGVAALRADGFEPVADFTGDWAVAELWPEEHRRSVTETRDWALDMPTGDRLWLIRSPWPAITLTDVFLMLWPWVERDRTRDQAVLRARAAELLAWDAVTAQKWLDEVRTRLAAP